MCLTASLPTQLLHDESVLSNCCPVRCPQTLTDVLLVTIVALPGQSSAPAAHTAADPAALTPGKDETRTAAAGGGHTLTGQLHMIKPASKGRPTQYSSSSSSRSYIHVVFMAETCLMVTHNCLESGVCASRVAQHILATLARTVGGIWCWSGNLPSALQAKLPP